MRKFFATAAAVAAILSSGMVYPQTMVVDSIAGDDVNLRTATGDIFVLNGAEDYSPGDLVAVIMYTNGTASIYDDVIVSARYSGFVVD